VYLNYGIHHLVNAVTEGRGAPAAVLIRALDPLEGLATMRRRRSRGGKGRPARKGQTIPTQDLCRGPGNLTLAMGIGPERNCEDLTGHRLYVEDRGIATGPIAWGPRIGIRVGTDHPWRAYVSGHPAVSGQRPTADPAG
jgi:DNA-3-methyladenine glycosylase